MFNNFEYKDLKLVGRSNYIKWLKKISIFLEIKKYILYINNSKLNPINFKFLYYNNINIIRNLKLIVKYIKQKIDFKYNIKKILRVIKIIISNNNKDYFKNKINIS